MSIMTAERVREKLRSVPRMAMPAKPKWAVPKLSDFAVDARVLCWDGALLHTGWICMQLRSKPGGPELCVFGHDTINQSNPGSGYLGTLMMAEHLNDRIAAVFRQFYLHGTWILIEAPAVVGHRVESSMIAGLQVWQQTQARLLPAYRELINAEHVSQVLCGNIHHDKAEITQAVLRYIPECTGRGWSQHQRDAAAVGLTFLYDLEHREVT